MKKNKLMNRICILLCLLALVSCSTHQDRKPGEPKDGRGLVTAFDKPDGKSFAVADVQPADSMLITDTAGKVFENKIGRKILYFPEEYKNYGLVYCPNNGLVQTIQECYDNHRPLILTPDVIWLAICQGVSVHINEKYDSLKNVIFLGSKPDRIVVRNDSLEYSAVHWKELIASFSGKTKEYTKQDYYNFFVSQFSTTTAINQTAYQVTLLESYKKGFEYVAETGCGIPSITLTGKKEDWQAILAKLDKLNDLGLASWAQNLKPVMAEFINVFDGKVNAEFWQSIYKNDEEYNAFYISGWIIKFFPYIKVLESNGVYDSKVEQTRFGEIFRPNEFLDGSRYLLSTLSTDNFPPGMAKIDVTWNNYFKKVTKEMEVYAGFFAIKQYPDKSLEPVISWAVCEKSAGKPASGGVANKKLMLKHTPDYWSPHLCRNVTDSAMYDIKRYKTQAEGVAVIKGMLLDSLARSPLLRQRNFSSDTLEFVIFSNGAAGEFSLKGPGSDKTVAGYLGNLISRLPEKWFPALAHPDDVMDLLDFPAEQNKIKIRANSVVKIRLYDTRPTGH